MDNSGAGGAGMPRWVKAFIAAFLLAVFVIVVLHVTENGLGGHHHQHAGPTPPAGHG